MRPVKTAIVTGANGFIGGHLTNFLSSRGIKVYAIVKDGDSDIQRIKQSPIVHIIYCNLKDIAVLPELIDDREIDVCFHFGWTGVSGEQRKDYVSQIRNIEYACACARVCAGMNCKTFIFASSIWEYECYHIMRRLEPAKPETVYSTAKIAASFMTRTLCNTLNVTYISAVITNVYGPGESSPRLINSTIRKLLNGEKTKFTSCTQTYDFIYIDDAVEAFYQLAASGTNNQSYYIGSLKPRPLRESLIELRDCIDSSRHLGIGELSHEGIHLHYDKFDIEAIKRDTGFEPKMSFKDGIRNTVAWIQARERTVGFAADLQV